jgi:glutathione peroxidase
MRTLGMAMAMLTAQGGIYNLTMNSIDGKPEALAQYKGKVVLVVNVASRCGFTPQYAGLEALYQKYRGKGLVVLGFPANDFLWQEPGSNEDIKAFCSRKYGVTFPMFAKIAVKGKDKAPLYQYLTDKKLHPGTGGEIGWNFVKFLLGRDGAVLARFGSNTKPESAEITQAIEAALR